MRESPSSTIQNYFPHGYTKVANVGILHYRPGKFAQIQDGKVISKLDKHEIARLYLVDRFGEVDPGVIEVALAVSAISAVLSSLNIDFSSIAGDNASTLINFGIHISAFIAFIASAFSAGRLYYTYLLQKFPEIFLEIGFNVGLLVDYYIHLVRRYFSAAFNRGIPGEASRTENDIGYLNLLAAFAIIWIIIEIVMFLSLLHDLSALKLLQSPLQAIE